MVTEQHMKIVAATHLEPMPPAVVLSGNSTEDYWQRSAQNHPWHNLLASFFVEEDVKANEYLWSWNGHWATQHYLTVVVLYSLVPDNNFKLEVIKWSKQMNMGESENQLWEDVFSFPQNAESRKVNFINEMWLQDTEHLLAF